MQLSDRWALITGASSGLGVCFAEQLAAAGMHVALTARRAARLSELGDRIRSEYGVQVRTLPMDLSEPNAATRLWEALSADGIRVHLLVNNAGFGWNGHFVDMDADRAQEQVHLNAAALTQLTSHCVGPMKERCEGFVLNVSSIQAYMSVPGYATYAATKAYIRHLSEALHDELKPHGVRVTCVYPGPTATAFYEVAGHELPAMFRPLLMQPADVTRSALDALFAGKRALIPGFMNRLIVAQLRAMPASLHTRVAGRFVASLADA